LTGDDLDKTFDELSDEITRRLGKAKRTQQEAQATVKAWKVKGKMILELGKGSLTNPIAAKHETQVTLRLAAEDGP